MGRRSSTVLTDTLIKSLKPKAYPYKRADGHTPKLYIVVTPKGARYFTLAYDSPETGKERFEKVGNYPATSLKAARKAAGALQTTVASGVDPKEEEIREEARQAARKHGTLAALLALNLERLRSEDKHRYADKVESDIERNIPVDDLGRPADSITQGDIIGWMSDITARAAERGRTGERSADYVKTYVSAAFEFVLTASGTKWARKAKPFVHLVTNPAQRIKKFQAMAGVGQRVLASGEVVRLWKTAGVEALSLDLALYIKLAFALGGQRVEELLWAPWSEFDVDARVWAVPIERRKIRSKSQHQEPHLVYITKMAAQLLGELHDLTGHTEWLFPDGGREAKKPGEKPRKPGEIPRTTSALNQGIRRYCEPGEKSTRKPFERFTPRDIRRSVKTLMGEAGLSKEIRDRIQGHAFSDVSSKHYDRYDNWTEKQAAMKKWERWLNQQINPRKKAKVVQLRSAAS